MQETFRVENIVEDLRKEILDRNTSVAEKHLASKYYERCVERIRGSEGAVIVGAGVYGRRFYEMLTEEGLRDRIVCFCDNSSERRGFNALQGEVISVEDAVEKHPNALFVITPRFFENEIMQQLGKLGVPTERIMIFTFAYTGLVD